MQEVLSKAVGLQDGSGGESSEVDLKVGRLRARLLQVDFGRRATVADYQVCTLIVLIEKQVMAAYKLIQWSVLLLLK